MSSRKDLLDSSEGESSDHESNAGSSDEDDLETKKSKEKINKEVTLSPTKKKKKGKKKGKEKEAKKGPPEGEGGLSEGDGEEDEEVAESSKANTTVIHVVKMRGMPPNVREVGRVAHMPLVIFRDG